MFSRITNFQRKEKNMKIFSFKRFTMCDGWNISMTMGMLNLGSP